MRKKKTEQIKAVQKKTEQTPNGDLREYTKAIAVFVVAIAVSFFIFVVCGQRAIDINSQNTMMNNVTRQSKYLNDIFQMHYAYLDAASEQIAKADELISEQNMDLIKAIQKQTDLDRIALVEPDGTSYYDNGEVKNVSHRDYFIHGMKGEHVLSDPLESSVDSETKVILGVPICDGDEVIGLLGGSYNVTALSRMMFNDIFGGKGYSLILDRDGNIISYEGEPAYQHITYGDNFFEFYQKKKLLGAKSFENVREDFASGSEGVLKIQNPGDSSSAQYLAYTPLGMNDWIICYIVPVSSATEQYSFFQAYEVTFIGVFLVLVCLLVMYIFHQNDQKNQNLLYTAQRDGLTNLYNKRYTEQLINSTIEEFGKERLHAFLIMDMDKFKTVNDVYGHAVGDRVLETFAATLQRHFRETDIVGRIGGDEFTVFMRDIGSREKACERIEALVEKVRRMEIAEIPNGVTISIGVAFAFEDGDCFMDLYKAADVQLYQTKHEGGNGFHLTPEKE